MSMIHTRTSLQDKIALALDLVKKAGATAEVGVYQDQGMVASVRHGEVDTFELTRNHGFSVTVYLGQRKGHASSTDFSDDAIRRTVQAAIDIAHFTAEDPCSGLADAALMASGNIVVAGKIGTSIFGGAPYAMRTSMHAPNGDELWARLYHGPGVPSAWAVAVAQR